MIISLGISLEFIRFIGLSNSVSCPLLSIIWVPAAIKQLLPIEILFEEWRQHPFKRVLFPIEMIEFELSIKIFTEECINA
jgi:hypothetical protein